MLNTRLKITNSNKKMTDWRLQLAEDLKIAAENVRKMKRKVFSYDEVIAEFRRVGHKDFLINNFTIGVDLNGVYFLDNKKNINYLFLIIKTDQLIPIAELNTKHWDYITVNEYLMSLLTDIINDQLEQLTYELNSAEARATQLRKNIDNTVKYLNKANERYQKTARQGAPKLTQAAEPANLNIEEEEDEE